MTNEILYFGYRAAAATAIGMLIGIERELSNHKAGIKTLVFVAVGSCLFSSLSFYLHDMYPNSDPTRILGQVVTGIGFLGAGVIFHNQSNEISGLTTAAIIWTVCALGVIVGAGFFLMPIMAAGAMVIVTTILKKIEKWLEKFNRHGKDDES
jgi:putative Mg2+ transporter-C (MgtC) family protein